MYSIFFLNAVTQLGFFQSSMDMKKLEGSMNSKSHIEDPVPSLYSVKIS